MFNYLVPIIVAHRGLHQTGHFGENSVDAVCAPFENKIMLGPDNLLLRITGSEVDVRLTQDLVPVTVHASKIKRTPARGHGVGKFLTVGKNTYSNLRDKSQEDVPLLKTVFSRIFTPGTDNNTRRRLRANNLLLLDLKGYGRAKILYDAIVKVVTRFSRDHHLQTPFFQNIVFLHWQFGAKLLKGSTNLLILPRGKPVSVRTLRNCFERGYDGVSIPFTTSTRLKKHISLVQEVYSDYCATTSATNTTRPPIINVCLAGGAVDNIIGTVAREPGVQIWTV